MQCDTLSFHNVAELHETGEGRRLQRVPEDVREQLNEGAQLRMRIPSSAEIRFVCDGPVELALSSPGGEATVRPFWGPFQVGEPVTVGVEPTALEFDLPDQLREFNPETFDDQPFSPRVCRVRFGYEVPGSIHYHGVDGDTRPPHDDEVPSIQYLAYGTSITEGAAATADHLTYPARVARLLGVDTLNLGSGGSAFCERTLADYFASREDWNLATFSISVNMLGAGFSAEEFRDRVAYMIETVADTGRPVVAVTPFPLPPDLVGGTVPEEWSTTPETYRTVLRDVVAEAGHDNLSVLEGPDLLPDIGGYSTDLLHPGDDAMIRVGENLAAALSDLVPDLGT